MKNLYALFIILLMIKLNIKDHLLVYRVYSIETTLYSILCYQVVFGYIGLIPSLLWGIKPTISGYNSYEWQAISLSGGLTCLSYLWLHVNIFESIKYANYCNCRLNQNNCGRNLTRILIRFSELALDHIGCY